LQSVIDCRGQSAHIAADVDGNPVAEAAARRRAEADDLCAYTHGVTADRSPDLNGMRVI
jgi:hypothetical protein